MLSSRDLLSRHSTILAIDSASSRIQVGVLSAHSQLWKHADEEAGVAIFSLVREVLAAAKTELSRVDAFVFCEGPGSVLGIRTAAVALRTWCALSPRACYAYSGLHLVAAHQLHLGRPRPFSVIADARRETWHTVEVNASSELTPLQRLAPSQLRPPLTMPEFFRHWAALPAQVEIVPYNIGDMIGALPSLQLFRPTSEPDAFLHEDPVYQTWVPKIHRAPQ
jgi:tRNA threonylcarbamoyladenosine biosynthesis protein TsaB